MILFKIIILGDSSVGKTCLMNNYLGIPFHDASPSTIGVEFGSQSLKLDQVIKPALQSRFQQIQQEREKSPYSYSSMIWGSNGNGGSDKEEPRIKAQIWNSSGQERFHSIVTSYYRNCRGIIYVCDMTRLATLNNLDYWYKDYLRYSNLPTNETYAVIVATKSDLDHQLMITEDDLETFSKEHGDIPYFIVSSKKGNDDIIEVFTDMMNGMFQNYLDFPPEVQDTITVQKPDKKSNGCCST